jgi:hypothetical protein
MATLLARFEFELVNKDGDPVTKVPEPDRNDMYVLLDLLQWDLLS